MSVIGSLLPGNGTGGLQHDACNREPATWRLYQGACNMEPVT